ncbi:MAG TPA: YajG family lipoprotein [Burkholderiales bacterium]|nr:YajG family lipoprotein [Burkholderiales bacterium]
MIQEIKWRWAAIGVFAILQGCALQPENIRIDPTIELPKSLVAGANRIGVAASDARAMKKLGEVGDPNREMFDVSVNEDPSPAIYSRVSNALGKLGYKVAPYAEGMEPSLKIEVETLKLDSDKRAFDFLTTLHAEVTAHARNGQESLDKTYIVDQSMNTAGPAYSSDTTRLVNTAVSTALQDMLADQKLLDVLNK